MKRIFLPLLATGLLSLASCGDANKANSAEGDTTGTSATGGDSVSTTMPGGSANGSTDHSSMAGADSTAMGDANVPAGMHEVIAPHKDDKEFMTSAAYADQNEIQQSKMALAKGVTGQAKDMANKMIADHSQSTAELQKLAAKKGVTLPTEMDEEHKALKPQLEKLSGEAFEQMYMAQMVVDHQRTANTMMAHEKMTKDADVKAFIAKTLPVVQMHIGMTKKKTDMKM